MRFTENGPDIPDELLHARDQGSVVFFCGSGVSRAKANLPDFFGLAGDVLKELQVPESDEAAIVFREAMDIGDRIKVSGLLSADHVFGFLERRYTVEVIRSAVACCIGRKLTCNLECHQSLMSLALTPAGRRQLVTTNFDRLFSDCDESVTEYLAPRLPRLTHYDMLDGVVYLHGKLNAQYDDAEGHGLVLSSSDFGRAYLSDGWATEFFRKLTSKFTIVFIGYSGDDPPIRYLLEGFSRDEVKTGSLYAFQRNESEESLAKWQHKNVKPIPFESFGDLWSSLSLWAKRADHPSNWRKELVALAGQPPSSLKPYQRGQVVHMVSTFDGAREFLTSKPSSEWLCAFDPKIRFSLRTNGDKGEGKSTALQTAFEKYGLDSDPPPQITGQQEKTDEDKILPTLINPLAPNQLDEVSYLDSFHSVTDVLTSTSVVPLPKRVQCLGNWIAQSTHEPGAIWWCSRQHNLHPDVKAKIAWFVDQPDSQLSPDAAKRWRELLECWRDSEREPNDWYDLTDKTKSGWSFSVIRQLERYVKPRLAIRRPFFSPYDSAPPADYSNASVDDICLPGVQIPQIHSALEVPEEWLNTVAHSLMTLMLETEQACIEFRCTHELDFSPIHVDPNPEIDADRRVRGFSGIVNLYVSLFERICTQSPSLGRQVFQSWPTNSCVFNRLKIWCASKSDIVSGTELADLLKSIDRSLLWNMHTRRDLLMTLKIRWENLDTTSRNAVEELILSGPPRWTEEDQNEYESRRNFRSATILKWLTKNGCVLSDHAKAELSRLKQALSAWKDEYAHNAADSREGRGGWISTDTDSSKLDTLPVTKVIEVARQLTGRSEESFLDEHDPFSGYCARYPEKALEALSIAADSGDIATNEWSKFFESKLRADDGPSFRLQIATALNHLPDESLAQISYYASRWFKDSYKQIGGASPESAQILLDKFVRTIRLHPDQCGSGMYPDRENRDWMLESNNSCVGRITEVIVLDLVSSEHLSQASNLQRLSEILSIGGPMRHYALTICCCDIARINRKSSDWVRSNLFPAFYSEDRLEHDSAWAGLLWHPQVDPRIFAYVKPGLIGLASRPKSFGSTHLQSIVGLLLLGWLPDDTHSHPQQVLDSDLHTALLEGGEDLRKQILWQLQGYLGNSATATESRLTAVASLLQKVWPKEKEARSAVITEGLLDLLLVSEPAFATLLPVALPLLVPLSQQQRIHFHRQEAIIKSIIESHPSVFLELLYKVLPDNSEVWPYGFGKTMELLQEHAPSLRGDPKFELLLQRWNSRW